jgi:hypothetical protein
LQNEVEMLKKDIIIMKQERELQQKPAHHQKNAAEILENYKQ